MPRTSATAIVACSLFAFAAAVAAAAEIKAPLQPAQGPGGYDYKHEQVVVSQHGEGGTAYHLFEPAKPKPKSAPVIVFNHGFGALDPVAYGRWIEHLVRRGNIVIYPRYQANLATLSFEYTPNAVKAIKDALAELKKDGRVTPEVERFAIVGHSAGGLLTANLAAVAKKEGLPAPKAVFVLQPGLSKWFPLADLKQIPKDCLLLSLAGDDDKVTGAADAKRVFLESTSVPPQNKDYITLRSDTRGTPALRANHLAPCAVGGQGLKANSSLKYSMRNWLERGNAGKPGRDAGVPAAGIGAAPLDEDIKLDILVDSLDYYGMWKLFDGLTDAAFFNKNRQYALGNTPQQRFMGKWSDGTPVVELIVTDKP